ncbi:MAG: hypothetical protein VYE29_11525 [Pseudomonadota bacterium]|nr:hypothetical protein [Pseudomonadota bacterium]
MKTEDQLDQAIAGLRQDIQPRRDLWADLEQRLPDRETASAPKRNRFAVGGRWAAVFAIALVGTLALRLDWLPDPGLAPGSDSMQMAETEVLPPEALIAQQFEQEKARQLSELGAVSDDFGDWRYQMAVWDQAIGQVQQTMNYYPDDPALLNQMEGLYRQQLDYIQLIAVTDTSGY